MDDCQESGDFLGNSFFRHFLRNDEHIADFLGREVDQRGKKHGTIDATN
jgi:hypothetical protein